MGQPNNYWGEPTSYKPGQPGFDTDVSRRPASGAMHLGTAAGWVALAAMVICGFTGVGA